MGLFSRSESEVVSDYKDWKKKPHGGQKYIHALLEKMKMRPEDLRAISMFIDCTGSTQAARPDGQDLHGIHETASPLIPQVDGKRRTSSILDITVPMLTDLLEMDHGLEASVFGDETTVACYRAKDVDGKEIDFRSYPLAGEWIEDGGKRFGKEVSSVEAFIRKYIETIEGKNPISRVYRDRKAIVGFERGNDTLYAPCVNDAIRAYQMDRNHQFRVNIIVTDGANSDQEEFKKALAASTNYGIATVLLIAGVPPEDDVKRLKAYDEGIPHAHYDCVQVVFVEELRKSLDKKGLTAEDFPAVLLASVLGEVGKVYKEYQKHCRTPDGSWK